MGIGNARAGQHAARWQVARTLPEEGDAAPRVRTHGTRRAFAHDPALVQTLFADLGQWSERDGNRAKLLEVRTRGETLATLQPKLAAIFEDCGVAAGAVHVRCADSVQREAHRGKVEITLDAQTFSGASSRMKWLLQQMVPMERGGRRA